MSTEILLPKIGFSMNEGQIQEWLVADGGEVESGQPLFTVESDKSVNEIEAPASGKLRIVVQPETTVEVGTLLGYID
jgi:pyruvate/2-oxoglutarate dehydrogenase complex dihydrolipoamide acyltransferase (E2) component